MNARAIWEAVRPEDRALLARLADLAGAGLLALVGGAVRDALLGQHPQDLDVVVEGAGVEGIAQASGLPFTYHPQFDNATLRLPDGRALDLIRARRETYATPGAPPTPRPADLMADLGRRDFTVNAVALLVPAVRLLDPHRGRQDLAERTLRPLHAASFRDDPSRLARGARLAVRHGLRLHPFGRSQVPDALRYARDSMRLRQELPLVFVEDRPGAVFRTLRDWGAGELFGTDAAELLSRLDAQRDAGLSVPPVVYAAAWLSVQPDPDAAQRYGLGEKPARLLQRALETRSAPGSPEAALRGALQLPEAEPALRGSDVLAYGVPPGPLIGKALAHLERLRRAGLVTTLEDQHRALREYLKRESPPG